MSESETLQIPPSEQTPRQHCEPCLNQASPFQRPKHTPVGEQLQTRFSACARDRTALPMGPGHVGAGKTPASALLSSICSTGSRRQAAGTHVLATWKQPWGKRDCCSHITALSWDPNAALGNHCAL